MRNIQKAAMAGAVAAISVFLLAALPAAAECGPVGRPASLLVDNDATEKAFEQYLAQEREIRQDSEDRARAAEQVAGDSRANLPTASESINW